jgi:hypothetical protein
MTIETQVCVAVRLPTSGISGPAICAIALVAAMRRLRAPLWYNHRYPFADGALDSSAGVAAAARRVAEVVLTVWHQNCYLTPNVATRTVEG